MLTQVFVAGLHAFEWILHLFEEFPVDVVSDQTPAQPVKAGHAAVQMLTLLPHGVSHPVGRNFLGRGIRVARPSLIF